MDDEEVLDLKKKLCVGRCCYKFYPTVVQQIQEDDKTVLEKTAEAILLCETCGHTMDVEFE